MIEDLKAKVEGLVLLPEAVWGIRSDALALRTILEDRRDLVKRERAIREAIELSEVCNKFYALLNNLRRNLRSKGFTQFATLWDMATVGSLALHDLSDGRWTRVKDILASAFSEGSMIMASIQYIKSADEVLKAMVEENICEVYGLLWELIAKERRGLRKEEVRVLQKDLDAFFRSLLSHDTPFGMRVLVLVYTVIIKIRVHGLVSIIDERALGQAG